MHLTERFKEQEVHVWSGSGRYRYIDITLMGEKRMRPIKYATAHTAANSRIAAAMRWSEGK